MLLVLSKIYDKIKVLDKIWDGNHSMSEAIGRCGGDEKMNGYAEPTQSNVKRIYGEEDAWLVQPKL